MTEPRVISSHRDRRLAPSTSWVAPSVRARCPRAPWRRRSRPPRGRCRRAPRAAGAGRRACHGPLVRPSSARTWMPMSSPLARARDARRPADQVVVAGRPGDGHRDALARLPRCRDAVALAVVLERLVDAVGHPQQGELAQGREVAGAEVVAERGVDLVGRVDVAVGHPAAQRLGRRVDQLDLLGRADDRVRDRLLLRMPVMPSTTSLSDSRCWMFTVEITSMPASSSSSTSCQRFSLRQPGTLVWASSSTRATSGSRARTASRSISSNALSRWWIGPAGDHLEVADLLGGARAGCGSRRTRRPRRCRARAAASPR